MDSVRKKEFIINVYYSVFTL